MGAASRAWKVTERRARPYNWDVKRTPLLLFLALLVSVLSSCGGSHASGVTDGSLRQAFGAHGLALQSDAPFNSSEVRDTFRAVLEPPAALVPHLEQTYYAGGAAVVVFLFNSEGSATDFVNDGLQGYYRNLNPADTTFQTAIFQYKNVVVLDRSDVGLDGRRADVEQVLRDLKH